jgi:hypothetical protein
MLSFGVLYWNHIRTMKVSMYQVCTEKFIIIVLHSSEVRVQAINKTLLASSSSTARPSHATAMILRAAAATRCASYEFGSCHPYLHLFPRCRASRQSCWSLGKITWRHSKPREVLDGGGPSHELHLDREDWKRRQPCEQAKQDGEELARLDLGRVRPILGGEKKDE